MAKRFNLIGGSEEDSVPGASEGTSNPEGDKVADGIKSKVDQIVLKKQLTDRDVSERLWQMVEDDETGLTDDLNYEKMISQQEPTGFIVSAGENKRSLYFDVAVTTDVNEEGTHVRGNGISGTYALKANEALGDEDWFERYVPI